MRKRIFAILTWRSALCRGGVGWTGPVVLLLEGGQGGEDEAEGGHHHEQARHDGNHLEICSG